MNNIVIGISGGSGFVGSHLTRWFRSKGYDLIHLNRAVLSDVDINPLVEQVSKCDIVINLAGANISKRWSRSYKREMWDSRIVTTRNLVKAINRSERVTTFISTSAVGIYPSEECYDESCHQVGETFLSELCSEWEGEARRVRSSARCIITRLGVVFASRGGAYERLRLPYRFGMSITMGAPKNKISWIDIRDLVQIYNLIVTNERIEGVVNLTASHPISQRRMAQILSKRYCTIGRFNLSTKIVKLLIGDGHILLTENCCVFPTYLQHLGYHFISPDFETFLYNESKREK